MRIKKVYNNNKFINSEFYLITVCVLRKEIIFVTFIVIFRVFLMCTNLNSL
jgi:hypothetical protein